MRATYDVMSRRLASALARLSALSGDTIGDDVGPWQQIAPLAAADLRALAEQLEAAAAGRAESFLCFPSPAEALDAI